MHALAALGSILGTFVTGFLLIQYLGSRSVVVIAALILFLLAIPFLYRSARRALAGLVILGLVSAALIELQQGFASPCDAESNYFCLRVVDASDKAPFGNARGLVLDHLLHGINHESAAEMMISPYVQLMQELVVDHFGAQDLAQLNYFFAGGGAYTQPRAIKQLYPQAAITVAELDPLVTRTVAQSLYVDPAEFDVRHGDARAVLWRQADAAFDVIVTDAFHDIAIPYHLVTLEYVHLARSKLKPGGLYTTNVVDAFPDPRMVKSMFNTLREAFAYVDVWVDNIPQQPMRMTYVISASDVRIDDDLLRSSAGFRRQWFRINEPLANTGTALQDLPVFTDDYVPVERMISSLLLTTEGL